MKAEKCLIAEQNLFVLLSNLSFFVYSKSGNPLKIISNEISNQSIIQNLSLLHLNQTIHDLSLIFNDKFLYISTGNKIQINELEQTK